MFNLFGFSSSNFSRGYMNNMTPPPRQLISLKAFSSRFFGREELDEGNKILLPQSILHNLSNYRLPHPMMFSLQNTMLGMSTNVGVLEFTAEPETCVIPSWLFDTLMLEEGADVNLQLLLKVPLGRYVKIQPHKTEFIELPDPRAILEKQLGNFVCLTRGDTISIKVVDKYYQLNILEVQPASDTNCICLIEADIEVDFAQPLDYEEIIKAPLTKEASINLNEEEENKKEGGIFKGKAIFISGNNVDPSKLIDKKKVVERIHEEWDPRKHRITYGVKGGKFHSIQFHGTGTMVGESQPLSSITNIIPQTNFDMQKQSGNIIPGYSSMMTTENKKSPNKGLLTGKEGQSGANMQKFSNRIPGPNMGISNAYNPSSSEMGSTGFIPNIPFGSDVKKDGNSNINKSMGNQVKKF